MISIKEYHNGKLVYQVDSNKTPEEAATVYHRFAEMMRFPRVEVWQINETDYQISFWNELTPVDIYFEEV